MGFTLKRAIQKFLPQKSVRAAGKGRGADPQFHLAGAHNPTTEAPLGGERQSQNPLPWQRRGAGEFWNFETRRSLEG